MFGPHIEDRLSANVDLQDRAHAVVRSALSICNGDELSLGEVLAAAIRIVEPGRLKW